MWDSGDRHTQAAILASIKTHQNESATRRVSNSTHAPAQRNSSYFLRNSSGLRPIPAAQPAQRANFGRRNYLAREGIEPLHSDGAASSIPFIAGATSQRGRTGLCRSQDEDFGSRESYTGRRAWSSSRPQSRSGQDSHSSGDWETSSSVDNGRSSGMSKGHKEKKRESRPSNLKLPPADGGQRVNLGGGWWQLSSGTSRNFQVCGLHIMVESFGSQTFLCAWEPQGKSAGPLSDAMQGEKVEYDLEVQMKCAKQVDDITQLPDYRCYLAFAIKDASDFYTVCANANEKKWTVERTKGQKPPVVISSVLDDTLKPNAFFLVFLRVRGHRVSLHSNGSIIFSGLALPGRVKKGANDHEQEHTQLQGMVGVAAYKSKCMIKDWAVRCGSASAMACMSPEQTEYKQAAFFRQPYTGVDDPYLVEQIMQDIIDTNLGITFDDIAELDGAKQLLNEAVTLPLLVPEFFTGIREPWKGVLLFGPPGTGKTMLAKAVAGFNGSTFFNVSIASLISKYRGESEKLIRTLFNLARHHSPSIVFLDELDALVSSRRAEGEHEASRRLKTELFVQMDGITSQQATGNPNDPSDQIPQTVIVLATTNMPWDLDEAIRRRLEKRIYIPLPGKEARRKMFEMGLKNIPTKEGIDFDQLAQMTEGYSGSDIALVSRDALMMPIRRAVAGKTPEQIQEMRGNCELETAEVCMEDFLKAFENTRPSVAKDELEKFSVWDDQFGSH